MSYKSVIDSFKVETNPKYQKSGGTTYCNIFAQDVMKSFGQSLPSGTCSTMLNALTGNKDAHWKSVTWQDAQTRANAEHGTIGITSDHVVVIYPAGITATVEKDVRMSMAGYQCFNNQKMSYAWTSADLPNVKFYSYY